ncbi:MULTISPECIES: 16S rRNA (cytosine(1402)-N(4))-methyltransferase RsmH [Pediococcus]|jgi:16S rRNA (cytosine1402-N4)-methyltransferase|uniref:Ribosomal RNA small subunit methyltransferase H n=2 Tax=Pediococcus parvulus TaxID=54062 RepID=A0A176TLJ4_9LACO|nr:MULTISPECIES: 16S rRNA (cytosine(1402)-N(4))-methyltransferase RsmH [Pediococcus]MCT3027581.1 16S rRNA (cytosine(1402)-N(4))-methyltransferase RsmH [Pediococcus parvulus]MCT3028676.1 16S rRNA (cytosine(1402)-N(4))-methyltransferase RsmH [Pediococcus parvulus]MCT3031287.1 16S rRNA (cytosine(1402)-N(4))-methyltransferase RsmH [Pediococcus parvulus]MCT3034380.1 16S rRNA (cytosine(1402)-N(4))-methyltransferase RsmH [Pediococcus parvulus]MDN5574556.1 16S rRNA (cytosine(1402)-N(4))-methyltransfer
MSEFQHTTVLLNQAIDELNLNPDGIYVDCTLGGGGHSQLILSQLSQKGHLYAFDQDVAAIEYNQSHLKDYLDRNQVTFIEDNFKNITKDLAEYGVQHVDGIVYDLGVSSPQLDDASRGFSYQHDAPLDMRMDQSAELTAQIVVNQWSYESLVKIFFRYGEERYSKQVAREIERQREIAPIQTTGELVELIKKAIPAAARRTGGHPAKRVFQAIRIAVNNELGVLETSLEQALDLLKVGGRISVITFQSLEDRLVKNIFKEQANLPELPQGLPVIPKELEPHFKLATRKPILPSEDELAHNHRAHSARLRVIEKIK